MLAQSAIDEFLKLQTTEWNWVKEIPDDVLDQEIQYYYPEYSYKTYKPFKHQLTSLLVGIVNEYFLYFHDMGVGKTRCTLDVLSYWKSKNKVVKTLVLVPNVILMSSWKDQIDMHTNYTCIELYGTTQERLDKLTIPADIYLLNYTGLQILLTSPQKISDASDKSKWVPDQKKITPFVKNFDSVVFDEIHVAKNRTALTFKLCNELSKRYLYRYGLTGTPFGRDPIDLWAQFYLVDRGETLGKTISLFREAFFDMKFNFFGGADYSLKDGMDAVLKQRILNKSLRYSKKEVNKDLPPIVYTKVPVKFSAEALQYYRTQVGTMLEHRGDRIETKRSFWKLRQITAGFITIKDEDDYTNLIRFSDNPKIEVLESLITSIPADSKIVIFNELIVSGDMISELLTKMKIKFGRLYSGTGTKERIENKDKFLNDPKFRVFLSNSLSGNVGLNFQIANYVIFYESPVSPIIRQQAESRCHRTGQEETTFIYDLVMRKSVDERVLGFVREGKDLFETIVENPKMLQEDLEMVTV